MRRRGFVRFAGTLSLVVLLKAWHYAQIRLAFGAMVFGFAPQDATVCVDGVPAEVAAQSRTRTNDRTVL